MEHYEESAPDRHGGAVPTLPTTFPATATLPAETGRLG